LVFSLKDDPHDTIMSRLVAAGADRTKIEIIRGVPDQTEDGQPIIRPFSIRQDVARFAERVEQLSDIVAVIGDPITAYLGEDIDSHKNADVRAVLTPFQDMAARLNIAVIAITHLRKSAEGDAVLLVTVNVAFVAAARVVWFGLRDQGEPKRRLFLVAKNNLGDDQTGNAYRLRVENLPTGDAIRAEWESDTITRAADEATRSASRIWKPRSNSPASA
jgi:putative DNA primase/helicase